MSERLTDAELAAMGARAEAVMQGPLQVVTERSNGLKVFSVKGGRGTVCECDLRCHADFIAHAREDVLTLLAEVRRLRGLVERPT